MMWREMNRHNQPVSTQLQGKSVNSQIIAGAVPELDVVPKRKRHMAGRRRLDVVLVDLGLVPSREKAQRLIMAGQVRLKDKTASKASLMVGDEDVVTLVAEEKFVSRGGLKLEAALERFQISCNGKVCLDLGASTGGFCDCLLQRGARRIYAVDVGENQIAWKLRRDRRVVVMEKTNARDLGPAKFTPPFVPVDLVVIDCSFI